MHVNTKLGKALAHAKMGNAARTTSSQRQTDFATHFTPFEILRFARTVFHCRTVRNRVRI